MTRLGLLSGALAVLLGVSVLTAPPAAAADQWMDIPDKATITVDGRGYGHGHGMSQFGAQGAALQGLSWKQIVGFYYPGTKLGRLGGKIKVLITADTSKDVLVAARDGLRLKRVGTKKSWQLSKVKRTAKRWRIKPVAGGRTEVSFKTRGWRVWRTFRGDAEFDAGNRPIRLFLPKGGGSVEYRGRLRSVAKDTVNILPLDSYLRGVVPREVPASWDPDAVRAQAVAARTYAAHERAEPLADHYQICDTTSCQVYGGYSAEHPAANAAIRATRKRVLLYDGAPAFTQYSASTGGWTATGFQPYLIAQEDPYDGAPGNGNPYHRWSVTITDAAIERAWPMIGNLTGIEFLNRDGNGEWGGRVLMVRLTGKAGTKTIGGSDFRSGLGLRSEWVNLTVTPTRTH